jgi:hypothetical protein
VAFIPQPNYTDPSTNADDEINADSAGNRTQGLCICSQELLPLDNRGSLREVSKEKT